LNEAVDHVKMNWRPGGKKDAEAEKDFAECLALNKELKTSIERLIEAVKWRLAAKK